MEKLVLGSHVAPEEQAPQSLLFFLALKKLLLKVIWKFGGTGGGDR